MSGVKVESKSGRPNYSLQVEQFNSAILRGILEMAELWTSIVAQYYRDGGEQFWYLRSPDFYHYHHEWKQGVWRKVKKRFFVVLNFGWRTQKGFLVLSCTVFIITNWTSLWNQWFYLEKWGSERIFVETEPLEEYRPAARGTLLFLKQYQGYRGHYFSALSWVQRVVID